MLQSFILLRIRWLQIIIFLIAIFLVQLESIKTAMAANVIGKWNKWELSINNPSHSNRPFEEFPQIIFTHESGEIIVQNGFYDDNDTWKFRFMGHRLGNWNYVTSSSDNDLDGHTGTVSVIPSNHPGMLTKDPANPKNWAYAEGQSHFPFYAGLHPDFKNSQYVDSFIVWMKDEFGATGVGTALTNVFWKSAEDMEYPYDSADQSQGFSVKRFRELEYLIEELDEINAGIQIFFYYDDEAKPPFNGKSSQEELLLKYVNARLSAYPLIIFDSGSDIHEYRFQGWPEWFVAKMNEFDPWNHLVGNRHIASYGPVEGSYDPPNSGYTSNGRRGRDGDLENSPEIIVSEYDALNNKPLFYTDQWRENNGWTPTQLKRAGWLVSLVGNMGWKIGSNAYGQGGDFDIDNPKITDPQAYKAYADLWQSLGYIGDFERCNNLISGGYCIGRTDDVYVIFKMSTNSMSVDLSGMTSTKPAYWINVQTGSKTNAANLSPGQHNLNAPSSSDWVLVVGDSSSSPPPLDTTPPTIPLSLNAAATSEFQIYLTWQSSSDPESGISNYKIYRNNTYIGQSITTSYSDTGLNEGTTYTYEVSAINGASLESNRSTPVQTTTLADTTPPAIILVNVSGDPTKVSVVFSEPVEQISAEDVSNYNINNGITVSGASLASDLKTVTLTTSLHTEGNTYTVTINNIRDRANTPNVIALDSQASYTFVAEMIISNLSVTSGNTYEVVMNGLQTGTLLYSDRQYTFTSIPSSLQGATYIKTANDDKDSTDSSFLTFDVNQNVTVYVAYDDQISVKPSWLSSFTGTGIDLKTSAPTLSLFAKDFPAGTIMLGGNEGSGYSMYSVTIQGASSIDIISPKPPANLRKKE